MNLKLDNIFLKNIDAKVLTCAQYKHLIAKVKFI